MMRRARFIAFCAVASCGVMIGTCLADGPLRGTKPLTIEADIASQMVEGVDRFLLRQLEQSVEHRESFWQRDFSSPQAYADSTAPNREQLRKILGVTDPRIAVDALEFVSTTMQSHVLRDADGYTVYAVRWPVMQNMHGEGLWLVPDGEVLANVIAIADADQSPESLCGFDAGFPADSHVARLLVNNGCSVLIPTLIDRGYEARHGRAKMTNREYLYRSAFVLGRHLIGYEVQKVLAGIDWFQRNPQVAAIPMGVIGMGEGGMIALYTAAIDQRVDAVCVSGYFGSRQRIWEQPLSRNVFGLLERFGDAELVAMVLPRQVLIDANGAPTVQLPSEGGAPAQLIPPTAKEIAAERKRLAKIAAPYIDRVAYLPASDPPAATSSPEATTAFWSTLTDQPTSDFVRVAAAPILPVGDAAELRQSRQFREIEEHNAWMLQQSDSRRRGFLNLGSDLSDVRPGKFPIATQSPVAYQASMEPYREVFRTEVIGDFEQPHLDFNARSRILYRQPKWTGYEIALDVFPDVMAYGILCVPNDLGPDEKRPVVVCQHGLEGRPQDTIEGDHRAYHDYAAKLAERGYVTFAPQNIYIGKDRFRTLQRKANPLGKTLFSVMVPQHQQIVDWLQTQPFVDPDRIAFYGLSYGGKSAMRIPALVPDYCLSICAGDFNDWVDKCASTDENYSYVWTGEYEIFEFNLGGTFNYAEMAALIAPRPFMVERGHFDRVGTDERVASEFAKVRYLYEARLGIAERCAIDWFVGPHMIHGTDTFEFLDRHLRLESN